MTDSLTFQIAKPHYSKLKNPSGGLDPCYTFSIKSSQPLSLSVEEGTDESNLEKVIKDNETFIKQLITSFLATASQYFARTYTVDVLLKHLKHTIFSSENSTEMPCELVVEPHEIIIFQGKFTLQWKLTHSSIMIRIPDLEEAPIVDVPAPLTKNSSTDELIQVDDLEEDLREHPVMSEEDISRHYEKRRVKEARLRAKLAQYKAERAMSRYLDKYGDAPSDSEWSDNSEDDDDESDED